MSPVARDAVDEAEPASDLPSYPIGSVDNALRLLKLFSEHRSVRIADASREIGVARSTAHRMIQMLQYRGYVSQDPETRFYQAGPELIRMSLSVVHRLDARSVAEPFMQAVMSTLDETVHLAELRGVDVFFLHSVEGTRSVRVAARTGMTLPAHGTASGKVLLAQLSPTEFRARYPKSTLKALTATTQTSRKALEVELALVRDQGYASNFAEGEVDVHSVAVPVKDTKGRVRFALAIAATPSRLRPPMAPDIARVLAACADEIGSLLPI